jgi:hypothetical protein
MDLTLVILLTAAPVGAFDVVYFHLWKFRLFERPESVKEEITHILRGFLVPTLTGILLLGRPEGTWFWAILALFAFDSLNTFLDVIYEPGSRAPRGVPPTELGVHFAGTTAMGAAIATFIISGWGGRLHPTGLRPHVGSFLPDWFFTFAYVGLIAAFLLAIFEAALFARALKSRSTALNRSDTV